MVKKQHEKRKHERHDIEFVISIYKNNKPVAPNNIVKNFSLGGCAVLLTNNYNFQLNDILEIHVEDNFVKKSVSFKIDPILGEVKYIDKSNIYLIGIEFKKVSKNNLRIIKYIIDHGYVLKEFPQTWQLSK
ncbi:PilZ domain-containing protein [Fluviispira multicolorata]|nr:PilZ domain-containing protein [Fluviispira multicolorata]